MNVKELISTTKDLIVETRNHNVYFTGRFKKQDKEIYLIDINFSKERCGFLDPQHYSENGDIIVLNENDNPLPQFDIIAISQFTPDGFRRIWSREKEFVPKFY